VSALAFTTTSSHRWLLDPQPGGHGQSDDAGPAAEPSLCFLFGTVAALAADTAHAADAPISGNTAKHAEQLQSSNRAQLEDYLAHSVRVVTVARITAADAKHGNRKHRHYLPAEVV